MGASEFEFVVSDGASRGQVFAFPSGQFVIGSAADCPLRFEATLVQPRHAEVTLDARGNPWVRDLTGSKLVWVNGEPTDLSQLVPGGFVRLGRLELVLRQRGRTGPSGTMATPTPLRTGPVGAQPAEPAPPFQSEPSSSGTAMTSKRPTPFDKSNEAPAKVTHGGAAVDDSTVRVGYLRPGSVIDGRYQVVEKIAAGGMGEVYKAEHVGLGKAMALKVMLPELSRDPEFVSRFQREAVAASRIGQQNIVDVSDFGQTADGRFYFVMEYLDGMTLASLVHREGALPVGRALAISVQVARALAAAHAQGIVHRDLKPENIMLLQRPGQADFAKVLDFGVAKVSQGHGQGGHTAVGMVVGTPQYMSPEQAKAIPVDARSDIYSLGLIIYELVTGRPTFEAETPSMLMVKHVTEAPPPFSPGPLEDVPQELETLVFQMLEKWPDDRPQKMETVVDVLDGLSASYRSGEVMVRRASGEMRVVATPQPASGVAVRVSQGHRKVVSSGSTPALLGQEQLPMPEASLQRRSPMPFILGAAVVLLGGGGAGYMALKGETPAPSAPPIERPTPRAETPAPAEPKVEPAPAPGLVPAPVPTSAPPEAAALVALTITTVPESAEVNEGDVFLGTTPVTLKRPVNTVAELTFSAKGYKPETKKVGFVEARQISISLEKAHEKDKRPAQRPKPASHLADDPYSQEEDLKDNPFN